MKRSLFLILTFVLVPILNANVAYAGEPIANDNEFSVDEDSILSVPIPGVLGNDYNFIGEKLEAILDNEGEPSYGSLTLNPDGSFTYTPDVELIGTESTTDSFIYIANDGTNADEATVTINIQGINDPPVAVNDAYSMIQDTTLNVNPPGVLANDYDVDGGGSFLAGRVYGDNKGPENGWVSLSSTGDGSFIYIPNSGFVGTDFFTYRAISIGGTDSDEATVTIIVQGINNPPVANDDAYNVDEDTTLNVVAPGVLSNDTEGDVDDTLTAVHESGPTNGELTFNADGSFSYNPDTGFNGTDSFTYRANDGTADSNIATVSITVNPTNEPPVLDPISEIDKLAAMVSELNSPKGISNNLQAKLDTAAEILGDNNSKNDVAATNALEAFINYVEAQAGKKIPDAEAAALISEASAIITLLSSGP